MVALRSGLLSCDSKTHSLVTTPGSSPLPQFFPLSICMYVLVAEDNFSIEIEEVSYLKSFSE